MASDLPACPGADAHAHQAMEGGAELHKKRIRNNLDKLKSKRRKLVEHGELGIKDAGKTMVKVSHKSLYYAS